MVNGIEEWSWDDRNLEYLGRRGATRRTVHQVAAEAPKFRRNRAGRTATHLMIGPDFGGTMWTICIIEIEPGTWRAFNAWHADDEEKSWYGRN